MRDLDLPRVEERELAVDRDSVNAESRTTEIGSIQPPQRRHFSTTWHRLRVLMKSW
jgi:hypothetical protein